MDCLTLTPMRLTESSDQPKEAATCLSWQLSRVLGVIAELLNLATPLAWCRIQAQINRICFCLFFFLFFFWPCCVVCGILVPPIGAQVYPARSGDLVLDRWQLGSLAGIVLTCLVVSNAVEPSIDWNPPVSSVTGTFQARVLEWVASTRTSRAGSCSRGSS